MNDTINPEYIINHAQELEQMFGAPKEATKDKVIDHVDDAMADFIARSPLVFLATFDKNGMPDISPKGDHPGFVKIDKQGNLLIPERLGNKLMFGFNNILANNNLGVIFVVPGTRETLRIKGKASLSRDPALLSLLEAKGKPALLCTHLEVKESFFHCGKAMIRSQLWKPESWEKDEQLMVQHFAKKHNVDEAQIEENLEQSYRDNLY